MRRRLAAPLSAALLALAGCGQPAPVDAQPAGPAVWEVADADTRIVILGALHVLPPGVDWMGGAVADAIATADELVLEIPPADDPEAQARAFTQLAVRPPSPVEARVPADLRDELRETAAAAGQPLGSLDHMDDWAVAVLLSGASVTGSGLTRENGVEEQLTRRFRAGGRPVTGLETAAGQFAIFDALSPAAQRAYLLDVLRDDAGGVDPLPQAVRDWSRGDADALGRLVNDELTGNPALREALLVRRNRAWSRWVRQRLDRPGTVLLAVGAGHLAGADSLLAMLAAEGVTVRRVQ